MSCEISKTEVASSNPSVNQFFTCLQILPNTFFKSKKQGLFCRKLQAKYLPSRFQSKTSNFSRSIRRKRHWFCPLRHNHDNPKIPKVLSIVIHSDFSKYYSSKTTSLTFSNRFAIRRICFSKSSRFRKYRFRSRPLNLDSPNKLNVDSSPFSNPCFSLQTDLVSSFEVSI